MARNEKGQFVPGTSGNPKGRPKKGQALTEILEKHSKKRDVEFKGKRISRKDALSQKLWAMALAGDIVAIRYIFDRIDGKPVAPVDLDLDIESTSGVLVVPGPIDPADWDELARQLQSNDDGDGDE